MARNLTTCNNAVTFDLQNLPNSGSSPIIGSYQIWQKPKMHSFDLQISRSTNQSKSTVGLIWVWGIFLHSQVWPKWGCSDLDLWPMSLICAKFERPSNCSWDIDAWYSQEQAGQMNTWEQHAFGPGCHQQISSICHGGWKHSQHNQKQEYDTKRGKKTTASDKMTTNIENKKVRDMLEYKFHLSLFIWFVDAMSQTSVVSRRIPQFLSLKRDNTTVELPTSITLTVTKQATYSVSPGNINISAVGATAYRC